MEASRAPRFAAENDADRASYAPAEIFAAGERNHHISNTAYPIAHEQTFRPYRVKRAEQEPVILGGFTPDTELCLYSHIPFCEKRCYFCEYTVVGRDELGQTQQYMQALNQEVRLYAEKLGHPALSGWDIGGGTPSFVSAELMAEHIAAVRSSFAVAPGFAISIETTPRIASLEPAKIAAYRELGIERISMGVQVTEPDLLKALGRDGNSLEHNYRATEHIRRAGFQKFNLDLMYGFAGQSDESWCTTLRHAIALAPDYITLYRMRYKLTRISDQADRVTLAQVLRQATMAKELLTASGYLANPGKNTYSRIAGDTGTSAYLTRRVIKGTPYLGVGLGAQSFTSSTISYNSGAVGKNLTPYLKDIAANRLPLQDLYHLPRAHMMAKMVAVSFYFGEINLAAFYARFGMALEAAYPEAVAFALQQGLIHYTESANGAELPKFDHRSLSLTEKGARHFNGTIALFFAPSVQHYLLQRNTQLAHAAV